VGGHGLSELLQLVTHLCGDHFSKLSKLILDGFHACVGHSVNESTKL
jgi:hypothetical protein